MRTYDPKCEELARYFLADRENASEEQVAELAEHIQQSIEDWLE